MHIIVGGTGQVGAAVVRALLRRGEPVTIVTRNAEHAAALRKAVAAVAVVDVLDTAALRAVFRGGRRAFLLNPSADLSGDTDAEERASAAAIVDALEGAGLEKVVAASTYGARPGVRCGDLTVLYEFEQRLRAQPVPAAINRGAYYMSNWAGMVAAVRATGSLPSFFPGDFELAMVAPEDLGEAAARRLLTPVGDAGIRHVEGPERYTPQDVADAFAELVGRPVEVTTIPREVWADTFAQIGFSRASADSYARMTAAVLDDFGDMPSEVERGPTSLRAYVHGLGQFAGPAEEPLARP